jgi:F-type H+-transporting ATPase subunit epsilon
MKIEIITPDKSLFEGEAILAQLPGSDGSFEVLDNHAPLIAILRAGRIKVTGKDKNEHFVEIRGGVAEMAFNKLLVLAE